MKKYDQIKPDSPCPCCSGESFAQCCDPILAGKKPAPTAEALMRARYCAYSFEDEAFILKTWHQDTRPQSVPPEQPGFCWSGLNIVNKEKGLEDDDSGMVEFIARFAVDGNASQLHEVSQFVREDVSNNWIYADGDTHKGVPVSSSKVGRNEPCPCGSGKKYKRCCGAA